MSELPPRLSRDDVATLLECANIVAHSARDKLHYARPITAAAGLSAHCSALDNNAYSVGGGKKDGWWHVPGAFSLLGELTNGQLGDGSSGGGAIPLMGLQQEASLPVQAQNWFNPLCGRLSAFPHVLSTTGGHSNVDPLSRKISMVPWIDSPSTDV